MRLNSMYHYLFGLEQYQEDIIEKQKRLRHLMHEQIRKSDVSKILKPKTPLIPASIPLPYKKKRKSKFNII